MSNPKDPLLLEHEIDGIRELDNKLPRWWVWLFYGTIAFAAVYLVHYNVLGPGQMMAEEYQAEMKVGDAIKVAAMSKFEATIAGLAPSKETTTITQGSQIFGRMCAPCHRADAGGLVGPNLTDDYWLHGPLFADNLRTIWSGVPEKGMVTWKGTLKPGEIYAVGSYIYTLRGTHPPNPKLPENQAPAQPAANVYE